MMAARMQAALAITLAVALHLGAFALHPGTAGASGSGAGGADLISLQAAGPAITDMVAAWDTPPAVSQPDAASAPALPEAAPVRPAQAAPNPPLTAASTPLPLPQPDALPQADSSPAPPPAPAVKPKPRPAPPAPKPAAEPRPAQPAAPDSRAAQAATGSGNGGAAGTNGKAQAPTLSQGETADLTASWGASIRARIEKRKRYPRGADGATGTVTVRLSVTRSGALAAVSIVSSSGHPALDDAAVKAVQGAGRFPAAPKGLPQDSYTFTLPMRFAP